MELLKKYPRVLLQKLFITLLLGAGCLAVGAAYYAVARDMVFLALSGILSIGCIGRSWSLYKMLSSNHYSTTEGICIGITAKPMRRYRCVRLMDAEGLEASLLLDKRIRLKIGYHYRIYLKEDGQHGFGSEYLDTALSGDCFLGIEELGEFSEQNCNNVALAENDK